MDKKLKAKWVKALMSGKYSQIRGQLCNGEGHCCLGVLEDVSGRYSMSLALLRDVRGEAVILDIETQEALAEMNDRGIPFPVIAGFIQENL